MKDFCIIGIIICWKHIPICICTLTRTMFLSFCVYQNSSEGFLILMKVVNHPFFGHVHDIPPSCLGFHHEYVLDQHSQIMSSNVYIHHPHHKLDLGLQPIDESNI